MVVLAAAKVGGINANNTTPADFAYENMQIQCNVIQCCHDYEGKKAAVSRKHLYLSPHGAATDSRGGTADRTVGGDK